MNKQQMMDLVDEVQYDPGRSIEYRRGYFDAYREIRAAIEALEAEEPLDVVDHGGDIGAGTKDASK